MFWKTKEPLAVTIPSPCHENWEQMSVVERGRYCQACQTVVTDFTVLSDDEIIRHIEQAAGGKMCGRFLPLQIDRALIPDKKVHHIGTFRKVAASLLLFYASIHKTSAQTTAAQHSTYSADKVRTPVATVGGTVIKGKVIDFTEQGVQGLELEIKEIGIVKTTDAHGSFKFVIPDSVHLNEWTIGPTKNGRIFLDSIGAMIGESEINFESNKLTAPLIINLYPTDTLKQIDVADSSYRQSSVAIMGMQVITTTVNRKGKAAQALKHFFARKKEQ